MNGGGRRIPAMPLNGRKERDEDLLLFKELHKREKDRTVVSLLQPVSEEFEPNCGNHALYRISSGKKGSGYEFFGENGKNDYDWLKTPPATPLFPSLEMEVKAPELVVQRELPILQPISRFVGNSEALKGINNNGRPKTPISKAKIIPARSVTPNQRQHISSIQTKNTKPAPILLQTNFLTSSNLSKNNNTITDTKPRPKTRGVSPSVRSTIPAQIPGFSNDTPANLRTLDRPASAARGRLAGTALGQKPVPAIATRPSRQSCSPSVTRGRKESELANPKGKIIQAGNGAHQGQIFGSKMVDKMMNARKIGAEERQAKPKPEAFGSTNNGSSTGYGRMGSKSSLDMAFKQMEMKRERMSSRPLGIVRGRSSTRE